MFMIEKKKIIIIILVILIEHYLLFQLLFNKTKNEKLDQPVNKQTLWKDSYRLTILCRTYSGAALELYNIFFVSYMLFWPFKQWINSNVVVIFDDENELDHRMGTILANLPPNPKVFFEKKPTEQTFCSNWRSEGYSRQQYSNFYSDIYSDHDYIGIVDSDTFIATQVTPEDLFVNGKPRIFGYNACCSSWVDATPEAIGGDMVGEFMVVNGFPVIIKREHFVLIRNHITKQMKAKTFEDAFYKICNKYSARYSQFDLIVHYLWNYKRDEYSWHLNDWENSKFSGYYRRMSNKTDALKMNRPIVSLMKQGGHFSYSHDLFKLIYDYLCVASNLEAGDCRNYITKEIIEGAKKNLFVDWTFQTANWAERGMPSRPVMSENPWSKPSYSWQDAYNLHDFHVNTYQIKKNWKKISKIV